MRRRIVAAFAGLAYLVWRMWDEANPPDAGEAS